MIQKQIVGASGEWKVLVHNSSRDHLYAHPPGKLADEKLVTFGDKTLILDLRPWHAYSFEEEHLKEEAIQCKPEIRKGMRENG